jgi:hypothetical protein
MSRARRACLRVGMLLPRESPAEGPQAAVQRSAHGGQIGARRAV